MNFIRSLSIFLWYANIDNAGELLESRAKRLELATVLDIEEHELHWEKQPEEQPVEMRPARAELKNPR